MRTKRNELLPGCLLHDAVHGVGARDLHDLVAHHRAYRDDALAHFNHLLAVARRVTVRTNRRGHGSAPMHAHELSRRRARNNASLTTTGGVNDTGVRAARRPIDENTARRVGLRTRVNNRRHKLWVRVEVRAAWVADLQEGHFEGRDDNFECRVVGRVSHCCPHNGRFPTTKEGPCT